MKKILFFLFFGAYVSIAQQKDVVKKYGETIKASELKKQLSIIASNEFEGRETGYKGQKLAADYIANYFKEIGIKNDTSYFQKVPLILQKPKQSFLIVGNDTLKKNKDYYFFPSVQNTKIKADDVVFAGYGIHEENYSDYTNLDARGKVLMVLNNEPQKKKRFWITGKKTPSKWTENYKEKIGIAKIHGASALLIVDNNTDRNVQRYHHYISKEKLQLLSEFNKPKETIPYFFISQELANKILISTGKSIQELQEKINKKGKPDSYHTNQKIELYVSRDNVELTTENVLGYIEGTDKKEELIVITAHYDHIGIKDTVIYNGADDDGSGTVAVLELAKAFQKAKDEGNGPRRSILFMTVSGEEKGLLGSQYYSENPVFPIEKTIANLNIDMIGRSDKAHENDSNFVYIIGSDMLSTELHNINEKANENYVNLKLDYTYNTKEDPNQYYYRSDHYNFAKHGIPCIFYFNGVHEDYHKPTDTEDKINYKYLEKRAKLVFYTAWELANRENRIIVDKN